MRHTMSPSTAVTVLTALAQSTRLQIFRLLVQAGPRGLSAGTLSTQLDMAPSALSFHFKELLHAGLVEAHKQGRFVIYVAQTAVMAALLDFLTENCCGGLPCEELPAMACPPVEKKS